MVSDREKALAMYQAMAQDKMAEWVAANPAPKAKLTSACPENIQGFCEQTARKSLTPLARIFRS